MDIPGKTLTVHLVTAAIFFAIRIEPAFSFDQIQFLHQGCYKDVIGQPDLPYQSPIRNASKNISNLSGMLSFVCACLKKLGACNIPNAQATIFLGVSKNVFSAV